MKNETAAAGRNSQRRRGLPTWSSFRCGSRWRAFLRSRLWLGLLPAMAFSFGIVFLVALAGGFEPAGKALSYGMLAGALNGFGWLLGIWAAVNPEDGEDGEDEEEEEEKGSAPARLGRFAVWLWGAGLLFLQVAFSDVMKLIDGTESWGKAAVSITSKLLILFAVSVPIWLNCRQR